MPPKKPKKAKLTAAEKKAIREEAVAKGLATKLKKKQEREEAERRRLINEQEEDPGDHEGSTSAVEEQSQP